MKTMDMAIADLYKSMVISKESALSYSVDLDNIKRMMNIH